MVFFLKLTRVNELIMGRGEKKEIRKEIRRILEEKRVNGWVFKVWNGEETSKILAKGIKN